MELAPQDRGPGVISQNSTRPPPTRVTSTPKLEIPDPQNMGGKPEDAGPLRIFAFDTQGVCGQLFSKELSRHLNFGPISHPFILAATVGPERIHTKLECSEDTRLLWEERVAAAPPKVASITYQTATEKFLREADRLEQKGKILFVKEYAAFVTNHTLMTSAIRSHDTIISKLTNPTVLPDELLKLITPIIFIRHPAIVLPSWFRAANSDMKMGSHSVDDEDFTVWTSLRWSRIIFDYLRHISHQQATSGLKRQDSARSTNGTRARFVPEVVATRPYIIDAVDAIYNTQATLEMVCSLLGIGGESEEQQTPASKKYFERAYEALKRNVSSNVLKTFSSKSSPKFLGQDPEVEQQNQQDAKEESAISLDVEVVKWRAEFGEDVAAALRRKVDEELPHYEYLRKFRLPVRPTTPTSVVKQARPQLDMGRGGVDPRPRSAMNVSEVEKADNAFGSPLRIISTAVDHRKRYSDMGTPSQEPDSFLVHSPTS